MVHIPIGRLRRVATFGANPPCRAAAATSAPLRRPQINGRNLFARQLAFSRPQIDKAHILAKGSVDLRAAFSSFFHAYRRPRRAAALQIIRCYVSPVANRLLSCPAHPPPSQGSAGVPGFLPRGPRSARPAGPAARPSRLRSPTRLRASPRAAPSAAAGAAVSLGSEPVY